VQNIGAYGAEVKDLITTVEAVEIGTGRIVHFTNAQCEYAYRQSRFKRDWKNRFFITHVTYRLCRTFVPHLDYGNIKAALAEKGIVMPTAIELRQAIIDIRKAKLPDPKVEGNAGSFFMNPIVERSKFEALLALYPDMPHYIIDADRVKIPAGWMIEQCGWKGNSFMKLSNSLMRISPLLSEKGVYLINGDITSDMPAYGRDTLRKFNNAQYYMKYYMKVKSDDVK